MDAQAIVDGKELPLLLTRQEVARLTGLGERTITRLVSRGVLRRIRPAGMRCSRYSRAEVETWVASGCPLEPAKRRR